MSMLSERAINQLPGLRLVLVVVLLHYTGVILHVGRLSFDILQILLQQFWSLFLQMFVCVPE